MTRVNEPHACCKAVHRLVRFLASPQGQGPEVCSQGLLKMLVWMR